MKTKAAILFFFLSCIVFACSKDKFTTEPKLTLESITPKTVVIGNIIRVNGSFTDSEGDLDSVLAVYKLFDGNVETYTDTARLSLTALKLPTNLQNAEFIYEVSYKQRIPGYSELPNDNINMDSTAALGFILIDKQKHRSEYKESEKIRLINP